MKNNQRNYSITCLSLSLLLAYHFSPPRGIGWRGRWWGGTGWGTHVNPWLIHVNVWQKPLQYCKVISLQLIKINGKKNKVNVIERGYCHGASSKRLWTAVSSFSDKASVLPSQPRVWTQISYIEGKLSLHVFLQKDIAFAYHSWVWWSQGTLY